MYKIKEKDWIRITEALQKKTEGVPLIDSLMRTGNCPFCGTQAEKDEKGNLSYPLIVDNDRLCFKTLCCSVRGGPCNYIMLTRKCTAEEAIKFLKEFIG